MEYGEFDQLLERARQGDQRALGELVEQYEPELRLVARNRIGPALRPYLDSMDLVQSVNKSLIIGLRQKKFDVASREELMGLVGTILRRKVAKQWRRHRRQRREIACDSLELADVALALRDHGDDPAESAIQREEIAQILDMFEPLDRRLLQLRLEGNSTAEAARIMDSDADVLRVRLRRLRRRLSNTNFPKKLI
jgi:RNA polymerase sigma-70 factor (ECF subfamily)